MDGEFLDNMQFCRKIDEYVDRFALGELKHELIWSADEDGRQSYWSIDPRFCLPHPARSAFYFFVKKFKELSFIDQNIWDPKDTTTHLRKIWELLPDRHRAHF